MRMTAVEAKTIMENISYLTDSKGHKTGVVLNLRHKLTQELFEDLMDSLTLAERSGEQSRPFEDFKKEVLQERSNKG